MTSTVKQLSGKLTGMLSRAAAVLLSLLAAAQSAHPGIPIEAAQREFQGRYIFLKGPPGVTWPPCRCTPAPPFPPDGFYGDLDKDPAFATQLVQDLASKFYGAGTTIYALFLRTTNGVDGIDGLAPGIVPYYSTNDFPPVVGGTDITNPTEANYTNCFIIPRSGVKKAICSRF
jgi:hypothetical protein